MEMRMQSFGTEQPQTLDSKCRELKGCCSNTSKVDRATGTFGQECIQLLTKNCSHQLFAGLKPIFTACTFPTTCTTQLNPTTLKCKGKLIFSF